MNPLNRNKIIELDRRINRSASRAAERIGKLERPLVNTLTVKAVFTRKHKFMLLRTDALLEADGANGFIRHFLDGLVLAFFVDVPVED